MQHQRRIQPPDGLEPEIARFVEELARAAARRENRRLQAGRDDAAADCPKETNER
jgi:hypothetical protein